ncbi:type II toxin-antitoxin system RelE/ParE family toxin [Cohaesibacter gelatinilyticus]|uniref:RelE toxin of RelE / RelB toxin-antitoxin system n=1 Tax=Cohaesibacter gelatinilyticus TaxID=372072 RepID=A0A285PLH3_9HYPH|nr:type II toxin-antitoxin system RelE/ParE family toxin [Cohaesibacter gelatinilyticus]SNZ20956.1 RelE toxin of RelE / RelB toxin-antitoxin system [Cohaesibacter gelatinilyticus]
MQTVSEFPSFTKQAEKLFSPDEKKEVIDYLASYPLKGDEIPGTSGIRKLRVPAKGKGKRGGARVIYYWYDKDNPIFALLVYGKGEKTDLDPAEKKIVVRLVKEIKKHLKGEKS